MNNAGAGLAATGDMIRNYKTMTNMKLKESDPFFHCKANYEATSRGLKGALVALSFDIAKEAKDLYINKYPVADSAKDFRANLRGISGAFSGKSLKETCPTHYKKY